MPAIGIALALTMHGDPLAAHLLIATSVVTITASLVLLVVLRDDKNYRVWLSTLIGHLAVVTLNASVYFFGVNSAVVAVTPIGTYFFALGQSFRGALSIHLHATLGHAALTILQVAAVIPEVGVLRAPSMTAPERIGVLIAIQGIFASAFLMARGLRKSTLATMEDLDRAVRDNAQRQALLDEAKHDLAWALRLGGPGRYTSQAAGSYRLGNVIGRGAMGEVYEAVHAKTGEQAAVKLLGPEALANPDLVARFFRELQIAQSLSVDNVVKVLEVPRSFDELPYLAMERLRGETLADRLRKRPRMTVEESLDLMRGITRGVAAAHAAGIVHRDLKPRNVFAHAASDDAPPVWKILDFGVSKLIDRGGTLTHGHVVGTPGYMAPEQARGSDVDRRADLYALGVIAYRVLTGRPAFTGRDVPAILHAVVYETPPRPSEIAPIPEELDVVLAIAMAKRAADRFEDADQLAAAFAAAAAGTLDRTLRDRADTLLRAHPWGSER
jgi:serine/threonine-protein kinase